MEQRGNFTLYMALTGLVSLGLLYFGQSQQLSRLREEHENLVRRSARAGGTGVHQPIQLCEPSAPLVQPGPAAVQAAPVPAPSGHPVHAGPPPSPGGAGSGMSEYFADARVSALEKFVKLDDSQRERLRAKYAQEAAARRGDAPEAPVESLEDIIGKSDAEFYRGEVRKAFDRSKQESVEKDVLWLGRRLGLQREQEERLLAVMQESDQRAERMLEAEVAADPTRYTTGRGRFRRMIRQSELKKQIIGDELKKIFTQQQYDEYAKIEAESASSDIGVWHGD